MAVKKEEEVIEIRPLKVVETKIIIVGDTPLIMHAWSSKAKRILLESMQGKKKGKEKDAKNPVREFIDAAYWLSGKPELADNVGEAECEAAYDAAIEAGARFGFPVAAIKQAATSAPYRLGWVKNKMGLRGAFFIHDDADGMVEIHSDPPVMREDLVRIGMGKPDLRYRPQFNNWWAELRISYNASGDISLDAIINAINAGGYVCGLGEWRPERDGDYGQFHVKAN